MAGVRPWASSSSAAKRAPSSNTEFLSAAPKRAAAARVSPRYSYLLHRVVVVNVKPSKLFATSRHSSLFEDFFFDLSYDSSLFLKGEGFFF